MTDKQSSHMIDLPAVQNLRTQLRGNAFLAGDAGYTEACLTWFGARYEQKPAIVILPTDTADVRIAVNFAQEHDLPIGVQGGKGHGKPGPANGALLLNFARMKKIFIDQEKAVARVEPGVKWAEVILRTSEYGLASLHGPAPTVGVTGSLLGAGFGWFVRQYGMGAASVRSLEVVTLDWRVLNVHQNSHPDLFWGLRGGGGNFGIVTSIEFALYPIKSVFGGQVMYPIEQAHTLIYAYTQWIQTVPETLTSILRIMHFPNLPTLPLMLRDKMVAIVLGCYNGAEANGKVLFQPMRTLGTPILDTFAQIPYAQIATISNDPADGFPVYYHVSNKMLRAISSHEIDELLKVATNHDSGLFEVQLRHLGGAMATLPESAMAASARDATLCLHIMAVAPTEKLLAAGQQSITRIMQQLHSPASVPVWIECFRLQ